MGRFSGGYTIVEVMIVIAITGLLFASAVVTFHGEQGRTGFSQSAQDIASKIQNYVTQISAGSYPGIENYSCSTVGGAAIVTPGAGSSSGCIFLGRTFEVQPGSGDIKSHIVVANRTVQIGGSPGTELSPDVEDALPRPAQGPGGIVQALVDTYTLEDGATVVSSKVTPIGGVQTGPYNMVGIYDGLGARSGLGSNNTSISMRGFPAPDDSDFSAEECIEEDGDVPQCTTATIPLIQQWALCIKGSNDQTAQLLVNDASNGITTKLDFDASC